MVSYRQKKRARRREMAAIEMAMRATSPVSKGSAREQEIQMDENSSPVQAWWESIANARSAIQSLISVVDDGFLETLIDSESPAKALLHSRDVAGSISARLHQPTSGSASDALCQWLYETFQTHDQDLHLVVVRFIPLIAGLYLSRLSKQIETGDKHQQQHVVGFEAVLLALYTDEVKARDGRPILITVPDLAQPSLYHAPRNPSPEGSLRPSVSQLCAPLEPHVAIMSTKRASIVGVALDLFNRKIALMPAAAKIEACEFVQGWAGQICPCLDKFDRSDDVSPAQLSTSMSTKEEIHKFDRSDDVSPAQLSTSKSTVDEIQSQLTTLTKISTGDMAYNSEYRSPMGEGVGDLAYMGSSSKSLGIAAEASSSSKVIGEGKLDMAKFSTDDVKSPMGDVTELGVGDMAYSGSSSKSLGITAEAASSSKVIGEGKLYRAKFSIGDMKSLMGNVTKLGIGDVAYSGSSKSLGIAAEASFSSLVIGEDKLDGAKFSAGDVAYNSSNKLQSHNETKLTARDMVYNGNSRKSLVGIAASSGLVIEKDFNTGDVANSSSNKLEIDDVTKLSTGDVAYGGTSSKSLGGGGAAAAASSSSFIIDEGKLGRAKGARIPLPWELLQPILRILGHCLLSPVNSQEVRDAASVATRMLFARVSHDLVPEAILATRSLIKLDIAARESANIVAMSAATCTGAAASKPKNPENLLVLK